MRYDSILAVMVLIAAPLAAQHPGMPGPGGGQMMADPMMQQMGPAMMKMMLYTPHHLLARQEALGLTPEQVARLTALRESLRAARDAADAAAETHRAELEQAATTAQPDTATLKVHFQAMHDAMGRAHWAMLASAVRARAVLSAAQLAKVEAWADSMQSWMQQHRQMMKPSESH